MRMQLYDFVVCWSVLVREPDVSIYLMFAIGGEMAYEVPWTELTSSQYSGAEQGECRCTRCG